MVPVLKFDSLNVQSRAFCKYDDKLLSFAFYRSCFLNLHIHIVGIKLTATPIRADKKKSSIIYLRDELDNVTDYNTRFSGITAKDLEKSSTKRLKVT